MRKMDETGNARQRDRREGRPDLAHTQTRSDLVFGYAAGSSKTGVSMNAERDHLAFPSDLQARDLVLLKVSPILLVDQDQVEIVACAELLVYVAKRRRQFKAAQKEADRNRFP